jgi:hypothetical protein
VSDHERQFLDNSRITIAPRDRLVVGGILRRDTVLDFEPDAQVVSLLPHNAVALLERTVPDLVLVESGALKGSQPWFGVGEPSVPDVGRRLLRVLEVARGLGRPTVLWWSEPHYATPSLLTLDTQFDFVIAADRDGGRVDSIWSPGVQFSRFSTVGRVDEPSMRPVIHGRWERPPARALTAFIDEAMGASADLDPEVWIDSDAIADTPWFSTRPWGRRSRRVDDEALGDLYRTQGLFLADPLTTPPDSQGIAPGTLRQLASGARVISGRNEVLAETLGQWIDWAQDARSVGPSVRAAQASGPRSAEDTRELCRTLFLRHDSTSAILALAQLVGIPARTARRDVCAVFEWDDRRRPEDFVDAVIRQSLRATEALIAADDPTPLTAWIRELERSGIPCRTIPTASTSRGLANVAASHAESEWLWIWSRDADIDRDFLLDTVVGGLMSQADVVARRATNADGSDKLPAGAQILRKGAASEFPDLAGGSLDRWSARGAQIHAVGGA